MSVIQFLISGGMASVGGDLPEVEQKKANSVIRSFGEKVKKYAITLQVPAVLLKVQQCTFLFVAKDTTGFHFVFADAPGQNSIQYRTLSAHGRVELNSIVHQTRIEIGEVVWAFSCPPHMETNEWEGHIENMVKQYVNTVLQSQHKPDKKISEEALSVPEIASGLEKFKTDYPVGSQTAFIMMQ